MGLEAATFIHQLNAGWPTGPGDPKAEGDNHLRLIKSTLQATFPNITGAVTATHTQINNASGSGLTGFAAPTVSVGLSAPAAGALTTALRSDARLQLDIAIAPTWTAEHKFSGALTGAAFTSMNGIALSVSGGTEPVIWVRNAGAAANQKNTAIFFNPGALDILLYDDAGANPRGVFQATRVANAVTSLSFGNSTNNPTFTFQGTGITTFNGHVVPNASSARNLGSSALRWASVFASTVLDGANAEFLTSVSTTARVASGTVWTGVQFGNVTSNPSYTFLGTGATAFGGTINVTGAVNATTVVDAITDVRINGESLRSVPRSTTATTLAIGDRGKCVAVSAAINIPASVFAAGDCVSIYNDSGSSINITISAGTLRFAGTALTGTRSLASRGMATLWFNVGGATPEVIVSGAGVA